MSELGIPQETPQELTQGLAFPRRYLAIIAVTCATAAVVLDGVVANIALPTIATELGIGQSDIVLIVTLYQFLLAMLLIPMSALSDRMGQRRLFQTGTSVFILATLLCLTVNSFGELLFLRALQAIGAALVLSVSSAQIRSIYPARVLGRGLALNSLTVSIFSALAPVIGAGILQVATWPVVFAAAAPLATIALLASSSLPENQTSQGPYDWRSAILYVAMMALLFAGLDGAVWGDNIAARATSGLCACAIGMRLFLRAKGKARPLLPADILTRPIMALSAAGALTTFASSMAVLVLMPFRLTQTYSFTVPQIASALAMWPMTTMIVAPLVGLLSDRLPAWIMGGFGLLLALIALFQLAYLTGHPSVFAIGWRLAFCGAGYACYTASNARFVIGNVRVERAASVGGLIATSRIMGQSIGAIIAAAILAAGWVGDTRALLIPAVLAATGLIFSLARKACATSS